MPRGPPTLWVSPPPGPPSRILPPPSHWLLAVFCLRCGFCYFSAVCEIWSPGEHARREMMCGKTRGTGRDRTASAAAMRSVTKRPLIRNSWVPWELSLHRHHESPSSALCCHSRRPSLRSSKICGEAWPKYAFKLSPRYPHDAFITLRSGGSHGAPKMNWSSLAFVINLSEKGLPFGRQKTLAERQSLWGGDYEEKSPIVL